MVRSIEALLFQHIFLKYIGNPFISFLIRTASCENFTISGAQKFRKDRDLYFSFLLKCNNKIK